MWHIIFCYQMAYDMVANRPVSLYLSKSPDLGISVDHKMERRKKKRKAADAGVKKFLGKGHVVFSKLDVLLSKRKTIMMDISDTGAQNLSLVIFGFFFIELYSTLYLLQNTFYYIK